MKLSTIDDWLDWISNIHVTPMDLGLERVKEVASRLGLLSMTIPVIIVGGTNGKGSTVAALEAIYSAAGFKTGTFTSPFLFKFNEQVRINQKMVTDEEFCHAFEMIEAARLDVTLTPFEFNTLAALIIFKRYALDVLILEVGLGGRLDAVNILDADVAVTTSIGIDHTEWLGNTREQIGFEKAGIYRAHRPVVCGDKEPPASLQTAANALQAPFYYLGNDFFYEELTSSWSWHSKLVRHDSLPRNSLATQNMATAVMVITLLQDRLPVSRTALENGLANVSLPGRIQVIERENVVTEIYDVSHNPDSVKLFATRLQEMPIKGQTFAVFSMLADKDISESIRLIKPHIHKWFVAPLEVKRAASLERLEQALQDNHISNKEFYTSVIDAYRAAKEQTVIGDRILVFGSFHTVADVMRGKQHGA